MVDKDDIYSKSVAAIDKLTLQIYKEFQEEHKDLLIQNPKEYWRRASIYKEDKLRKILYNMKKWLFNNFYIDNIKSIYKSFYFHYLLITTKKNTTFLNDY